MKRSKKLISLLLVLILVLGAAYGAALLDPENQENEETVTTVFSLDTGSVTALSWDYSEEVRFEKKDDTWVYTPDEVFPLDTSYIDTILETLTEVTSSKTIEAVEDWDQYTLEAPICEITVTADGNTHTLKIGEETTLGGQRYFSTGDGNAYLVDAGILDAFSYGLYDLLSCEPIPDMTEVKGLTLVSDSQSYEITYQENSGLAYSDDYVWFMDDQVLDTELTQTLLSNITALSWGECVSYNAEDLTQYGLDAPAAIATVRYTDTTDSGSELFTLEIGSENGDCRYARIAGSGMVYEIDAAIADTLLYTTYYELQPDEVVLMNWDEVTSIDVTLHGATHTVVKGSKTVTDDEGNETPQTIYTLNGEEVDFSAVTGILDGMASSGYATGLTPERTEEIRLVIHRDQTSFPTVELVFYQYNSESCMTTLNGKATVFADRKTVVALVEEVNARILGG